MHDRPGERSPEQDCVDSDWRMIGGVPRQMLPHLLWGPQTKRDQIKMRDYMDRPLTPPQRDT